MRHTRANRKERTGIDHHRTPNASEGGPKERKIKGSLLLDGNNAAGLYVPLRNTALLLFRGSPGGWGRTGCCTCRDRQQYAEHRNQRAFRLK